MKHSDEYYMKKALLEARKAYQEDEVPIGAIVVDNDGQIIGKGHNKREASNDPTSHAEINAIKKACKKLKSWRIPGCKIYVTVEPCSMCAGAILWSRIDKVIYGATDPKGGALDTSFKLYDQPNLNHHPSVKGGILKEECQSIIKTYFKEKREAKVNEKIKNSCDL